MDGLLIINRSKIQFETNSSGKLSLRPLYFPSRHCVKSMISHSCIVRKNDTKPANIHTRIQIMNESSNKTFLYSHH